MQVSPTPVGSAPCRIRRQRVGVGTGGEQAAAAGAGGDLADAGADRAAVLEGLEAQLAGQRAAGGAGQHHDVLEAVGRVAQRVDEPPALAAEALGAIVRVDVVLAERHGGDEHLEARRRLLQRGEQRVVLRGAQQCGGSGRRWRRGSRRRPGSAATRCPRCRARRRASSARGRPAGGGARRLAVPERNERASSMNSSRLRPQRAVRNRPSLPADGRVAQQERVAAGAGAVAVPEVVAGGRRRAAAW